MKFNDTFPLISSPLYMQHLCLAEKNNMQFVPKSFVYIEFLSKTLSASSSPEVVYLIPQTCYSDVASKWLNDGRINGFGRIVHQGSS